jgi:CheY-like chemotaxis protein
MAVTVWIVDDDQEDLDFMKEMIGEIDPEIECIAIEYPEEAIRITSEALIPPNFMFIDINMPKMTGDLVLKEIRKNKKFDNTIITMLSTTIPASVEEILKACGANYTVEKPAKVDEFREVLTKILRGNA